jgi:integrase
MTTLTLKFVKRYKDRHGKVRHYYRRPGYAQTALPGDPGSEEFMAAYALAHESKTTAGEARTRPGTIRALVVAYYQSNDWRELGPDTHRTYRHALDRFCETAGENGVKYGDLPARGLQRRHAYQILDRGQETPGATRNLIKRLRKIYEVGKARGLVDHNPFADVELPREGKGFRPWTDDDIAAFEHKWPIGTKPRLALQLLLYTIQRRSDVVLMGRQHRRGDALVFTQKKGNAARKLDEVMQLVIPLHPELKAALDVLPTTNLTYLVTEYGKPFSAAGFSAWFKDKAIAAGLPAGSTPHGLRKAGSRRLAEADCTPHQIAALTGHRSLKEVERYTRSARQEQLARSAMAKLDEA